MNFISTFEELNKLYEEAKQPVKKDKKLDEPTEEPGVKKTLKEAAEDEEIEIVDDEVAEETEPRQMILECDKCGALVIKSEEDIVTDEESGLVNVEDKCDFCEETAGYKIIGTMVPYESADEADEAVEDEEPVEDEIVDEEEIIEEDLADVARKVLDKPASINAQQSWEAELNGEMGEISDKRRKHLEKKFQQQRDWEARHKKDNKGEEDLEELLNFSVPVSVTANGNDVTVGGVS